MRRSLITSLILAALVSFGQIVGARQSPPTPARPAAPAAESVPPDDATAAKHAAAIVEGFGRLKLFNGAVLVARGDRVIYAGATGVAHPEFNAPLSASTPFRTPGITQLFTVAAIMRLADQQKVALTDPAAKYLPGLPATHQAITLQHLLIGNPGLKDVSQMPEFTASVAVPRSMKDLVALIAKDPSVSAPGTTTRAPNTSYHLLAAVIEQVSGVSYGEFLDREFIKPLGLTSTRVDDPSAIIPGRAAGLNRRNGVFTQAPLFHAGNAVGVANLSSTIGEVFTFTRAFFRGAAVSPARLTDITTAHLTPPSVVPPVATTTPSGAAPAAPAAPASLGYALTLLTRPARIFASGGNINGFTSSLQYLPDTDATIVILSNVGNAPDVGAIARGLVTMLRGQPIYVPEAHTATTPRAEDLAAVAGTWNVANAFTITPSGSTPLIIVARVDGQRLFVKIGPGPESEWMSDGPGKFFLPHSDTQITLTAGKPSEASYVNFGLASALKKAQ